MLRQGTCGTYGEQVEGRDAAATGVVGVGGVLGGLARYGVDELLPWQGPGFPWATFIVNVAGCVTIGVVLVVLLEGPTAAWWVRPLVAVGFVGGFTTFSTFAVEQVVLGDKDSVALAVGYSVITVLLGLLAVRSAASVTSRLVSGRTDGWDGHVDD